MSDSHPSDARPVLREPDRESRAEALLLEGLDQYLAGHYDDAIHVWTRVLFIDRGHQRARAYIERARSALGERQRRAEELLDKTEALVAAGSLEQARTLLSTVAQTSTDDARVATLWTNIDRAERAKRGAPAVPAPAVERKEGPVSLRAADRRSAPVLRWVAIAALGVLVATAITSPALRALISGSEVVLPPTPSIRPPALQVPAGAEVALIRARTLYARGRLAEALAVLDRASVSSADRAAVDAFRVEIQSVLLSTVVSPSPTAGSTP